MNNKRKPTVYRAKGKKKAGFSSGKTGAVLPTVVTIAAAGLICALGYSIAKPISNSGDAPEVQSTDNLSAEGTTTTAVTTNMVMLGETTTTTTATSTTVTTTRRTNDGEDGGIDVYVPGGSDSDDGSSTGGSSSPADGNGTGTGDGSGSGSDSGSDSNGGTGNGSSNGSSNGGVTVKAGVYKEVQCSVRIPESSVASEDALRAMLKNVKSKYPNAGAVVIPMKLSGGKLNFSSTAAGNAAYAVCSGTMTASEIAKIVQEEGFYAYASCSLLDDNVYSTVIRDAGYKIEKNGVLTGDQWYDYYPDQGGKPWLDPNSSSTVSYLKSLVKELSDGGFSAVLCSGFTYPDFVQADEKYLNPDIYAKNPDALIDLANTLAASAPSTTDIVLDLSAYNAMNGWEPVYEPSELDVSYALLSTSSSNASSASSWAQSNSGDMSVSISYTDGSGSGHHVVTY